MDYVILCVLLVDLWTWQDEITEMESDFWFTSWTTYAYFVQYQPIFSTDETFG